MKFNKINKVILIGLTTLLFGLVVFQVRFISKPEVKAAAGSNSHLQYFGYWDTLGDGENPYPFGDVLNDQRAYSNVFMDVRVQNPAAAASVNKVIAAGSKLILGWPFWGNIDAGSDTTDPAIFNAWVQTVSPFINNIAAVGITDEPDCNYKGATFPTGWTPEN